MRCPKFTSLQLARSSCSAVPAQNDLLHRASIALMRASTTAQPTLHDITSPGGILSASSSTSVDLSLERVDVRVMSAEACPQAAARARS